MSSNDLNAPPALCSTCLGPSKHLRLIRDKNSLECKLCTRPFTVYKWTSQADGGSRKHTVICLTCARQRNCCQCCLLDLTYGISIHLRDAALKMAGLNVDSSEPTNVVSKLYIANNESKFDKIGGAQHTSDAEKAKEILTKLALSINNNSGQAEKKKNSLPPGINSIDITKLLSKLPLNGTLKAPADESIRSFFIFGIDESLPEYKLTDYFEKFGPVKSLNCQHAAKSAYITFETRSIAQKAASEILKTNANDETKPALFVIDNIPLRCCWGKERSLGSSNGEKVKLGSVVSKVMKKLAKENPRLTEDRNIVVNDTDAPKKRAITSGETPASKKRTIAKKTTYKSLSKSFEL